VTFLAWHSDYPTFWSSGGWRKTPVHTGNWSVKCESESAVFGGAPARDCDSLVGTERDNPRVAWGSRDVVVAYGTERDNPPGARGLRNVAVGRKAVAEPLTAHTSRNVVRPGIGDSLSARPKVTLLAWPGDRVTLWSPASAERSFLHKTAHRSAGWGSPQVGRRRGAPCAGRPGRLPPSSPEDRAARQPSPPPLDRASARTRLNRTPA